MEEHKSFEMTQPTTSQVHVSSSSEQKDECRLEDKQQTLFTRDIIESHDHTHDNSLHEELLFQSDHTFFLFVNPTSGGNLAADFIQLETEKLSLRMPSKQANSKKILNVDIYIYNLKNNENKERGLKLLKSKQNKGVENLKVIVGGGDGTVMWVIEEMVAHDCDIIHTPIGIVPFGTGNDFARVLNWGGTVEKGFIGKNLSGLRGMVEKWIAARIDNFDIWEVTIDLDEKDGVFRRIENVDGRLVKVDMKNPSGDRKKTMTKWMSNYMSVGVDARIGMAFDRKRTTSQRINKCIYCWEGFLRLFIHTKSITQVVDVLEELHVKDVEEHRIHDINLQIEDSVSHSQVVFSTRTENLTLNDKKIKSLNEASRKEVEQRRRTNILKGDPACLIMLNIDSYAGGTRNIWSSSNGKVALQKMNDGNKTINVADEFEPQNFGDGKLEFVSFRSALTLGNERFMNIHASRVAQGKGPFLMKFKSQSEEEQRNNEPFISYFQVDGEYYEMQSPSQLSVKPNPKLPNGKIKVLINTVGDSY